MKSSAPTIRDVAAAAQVSTATVSKYINGAQRFSPKVEAALDAAIASLGYKSNPLAKSMITGRTNTIGLSVLDVTNPHFSSILKGANRVAHDHEYSVVLVDTEETPSRERRTLEDLSRRVDGLIVSSRLREHEMGWMAEIDKPLVFFGSLNELPLPTVASDDRLGGIRACLDAAGLPLAVFDAEGPSMLERERMCSNIVLGASRPDAVICYNDLMALGFMKEAASLGLSIPRDLSVVGFDNIPYGKYVTPALTTVDLQSERMGATAMSKLLSVIRGEQVDKLTKVAPQLVLRSSTIARQR